jgi:hypothetical protein
LRWLHASADLIAFARESAGEVLVVVAARAAAIAHLGLTASGLIVAEGSISVAGGVVSTGGAAFAVWSLGPSTAPDWRS